MADSYSEKENTTNEEDDSETEPKVRTNKVRTSVSESNDIIIEPAYPWKIYTQPSCPRPQMYVGHYAGHQVYKNSRILCSNCGELGHTHKACMEPVTSFGIVCFDLNQKKISFLLIQRKHSISYIDFVRGKYTFENIGFLNTLFKTMTEEEKKKLTTWSFEKIWDELWINDNRLYRHEYKNSKKKYEIIMTGFIQDNRLISVNKLIKENPSNGTLEWGFPKGRRDKNESDIRCAHREFQEETNYERGDYIHSEDLPRFTEEFIGTNGIAYRYVYYVCRSITNKKPFVDPTNRSQISEIGNIGWYTYEDAVNLIGKRNRRRVGVLRKIYEILKNKYIDEL